MKTAISVPDETFEQVERESARLGMNRSQFFAEAARRYLAELRSADVTHRLNEAIAAAGPEAEQEARHQAHANAGAVTKVLEKEDW